MKRRREDKNKIKFTLLGEFIDKELEKEFCNVEMKRSLKYIKPMVFLLGILFFLFIIPDYFSLKNTYAFIKIFYIRIITVFSIAIFYFILDNIKEHYKLISWLTIYEIVISFSFLFTYYLYPSANFIIHDLGLITIILVIYLVTNKLINMFFVSVTISLGFFILSLFSIKDIKFSEFCAVIVYTSLVIIISTISKYRSNYFERMQYVSNCQLLISSITDPLTGVYNRLKFDLELDKWISYSKINKLDISLVSFDFDDFKKINDTFGHQVGDNVLIDYTRIIKNMIRSEDIISRCGGDEFSIMLPGTSLEDAIKLVDRIIKELNDTCGEAGRITCSFGIASLKQDEDKISLLKRADIKLYEAKAAGKNCMRS